jgi:hypothetical protein
VIVIRTVERGEMVGGVLEWRDDPGAWVFEGVRRPGGASSPNTAARWLAAGIVAIALIWLLVAIVRPSDPAAQDGSAEPTPTG